MIYRNKIETILKFIFFALISIIFSISICILSKQISLYLIAALPIIVYLIINVIVYKIIVTDEYIKEVRCFKTKVLCLDQIRLVYKDNCSSNNEVIVIESKDQIKNFIEIYSDQVKNSKQLYEMIKTYDKNDQLEIPFRRESKNGYQNIGASKSYIIYFYFLNLIVFFVLINIFFNLINFFK